MAAVEVERKWLVAGLESLPADVLAAEPDEIDQGYLTIGADGGETRVRRRGGRFTLTVKSGRGLVRKECEVELDAEQFEALWPATEGARVQKSRRSVAGEGGLTIEVDVYAGALSGLVVAEVEFDDPWGAEAFVVPPWFEREVTSDDAYKNRSLAVSAPRAEPQPRDSRG
jgi:CYTH domain-containing protein